MHNLVKPNEQENRAVARKPCDAEISASYLPYYILISAKISWCSHWRKSVTLWSLHIHNTKNARLISRGIIWSRYTLCSKKHPLTFSFISPWKMFQNFHGMFVRNCVKKHFDVYLNFNNWYSCCESVQLLAVSSRSERWHWVTPCWGMNSPCYFQLLSSDFGLLLGLAQLLKTEQKAQVYPRKNSVIYDQCVYVRN